MRPIFILGFGVMAITSVGALAATKSEVMASRYLKYNFCMQKVLGQLWWKKSGVAVGMNPWGVTEPTREAITKAQPRIIRVDSACRKTNEIEDQSRPEFESLEKKESN
jgi:hypothetical protein